MVSKHLSLLMFLIPIVIGLKTTVSKVESAVNNSDNITLVNATPTEVVNNSVVDLPIMTEGGSIGTKQTIATLAKGTTLLDKTQPDKEIQSDIKGTAPIKAHSDPLPDNKNSTLIKMQTDPLTDITTKNTGKSIVGRKGVNFQEDSPEESSNAANPAKDTKVDKKIELTDKAANNTANLHPKNIKSTTPPVPHKPTVLDASALGSSGDKTMSLIAEGLKHKQATNPGSHPGMIMPIVITVLVVPMFAVLGYMALKRGQEAWKNRHYKRMDFLLDGMYND